MSTNTNGASETTAAHQFPMMNFLNGTISMAPCSGGFSLKISPELQGDPLRSRIFGDVTTWAQIRSIGREQGPISCVGLHEGDDLVVQVLTPSHGPVTDEELSVLVQVLRLDGTQQTGETASAAG